jgi:glycosyltransferase involved in cell wall biosynthesis
VPVFNEAATIDELLCRVLAAPYAKQVIVVDDGSTDGTEAILSEWKRQSLVEVFGHDRNRPPKLSREWRLLEIEC